PSMASSGRWSIQLIGSSHFDAFSTANRKSTSPKNAMLFRRARDAGNARIGDVIRIETGSVAPAVLVVIGQALLGEPDHAVERAARARVPHRLDADVLVVAGVVHLVELVAAAELGAHRVPKKLHHLDALLVTDAVRPAHVFGEILVDLRIAEILGRGRQIDQRGGGDLLDALPR